MNETERREAAENQAWEELPNESDPVDIWLSSIEDICDLGSAVRALAANFESLPKEVQELWKPGVEYLKTVDSQWIATRTEEILQEGASEQLADRLAQEEDDLGDQE